MSLADLAHLTPEQQQELAWFGAGQGQTDPKQLAGKPQVWKVGGRYFVAYNIPGTTVPLVWEATQEEIKERFGGIDSPMPPIDREMSEADFAALAPWQGGRISEIRLTTDDPWSQFYADYRESADLRPWLNDGDMLATIATAYLEGRTPTADELSQTEWWQNHTAAERTWMETSVTLGPAEIERQRNDAKRRVTNRMLELGLKDVNPSIIGLIAVKMLTGQWSEEYGNEQINKLADPYSVGELHPDIAKQVTDKMRTTRLEEDTVLAMASQWLGPTMGAMTPQEVERWAGRLRNNPDAKVEFEEHLRQQRMAMFPTYTNPNLTYEDIVSPVRNLATSVWGRPVTDETMLVDLANLGDFSEMQKRLRKSGLDQGVQKVVNDSLDELGNTALGEQVVRSAI